MLFKKYFLLELLLVILISIFLISNNHLNKIKLLSYNKQIETIHQNSKYHSVIETEIKIFKIMEKVR